MRSYAENNGDKNKIITNIYDAINSTMSRGNKRIFAKRFTSVSISTLVKDVVNNIPENFISLNNHREDLSEVIINFSEEAKDYIGIIDNFIYNKIICSNEVVSYDMHGANMIKGLLEAYSNDIRLLPKDSLLRINTNLFMVDKSFEYDFSIVNDNLSKKVADILCQNYNVLDELERLIKSIVIREIVDFVSGVTDTYAEHLYEEIYKMKISSY